MSLPLMLLHVVIAQSCRTINVFLQDILFRLVHVPVPYDTEIAPAAALWLVGMWATINSIVSSGWCWYVSYN